MKGINHAARPKPKTPKQLTRDFVDRFNPEPQVRYKELGALPKRHNPFTRANKLAHRIKSAWRSLFKLQHPGRRDSSAERRAVRDSKEVVR